MYQPTEAEIVTRVATLKEYEIYAAQKWTDEQFRDTAANQLIREYYEKFTDEEIVAATKTAIGEANAFLLRARARGLRVDLNVNEHVGGAQTLGVKLYRPL